MGDDMTGVEKDFFSDLSVFLKKERIQVKLSRKSSFEGQIDVVDKSCIVKFIIDTIHRELWYDIYLPNYAVHLDEKFLYNFNKLYSLQKKHGEQRLPTYIADIWVIFDEIDLWAKRAKFVVKQKKLT